MATYLGDHYLRDLWARSAMMLMSGGWRPNPEPLLTWRHVGPTLKDLARVAQSRATGSPDPATVVSLAHMHTVQRNSGTGKNHYSLEEEVRATTAGKLNRGL